MVVGVGVAGISLHLAEPPWGWKRGGVGRGWPSFFFLLLHIIKGRWGGTSLQDCFGCVWKTAGLLQPTAVQVGPKSGVREGEAVSATSGANRVLANVGQGSGTHTPRFCPWLGLSIPVGATAQARHGRGFRAPWQGRKMWDGALLPHRVWTGPSQPQERRGSLRGAGRLL